MADHPVKLPLALLDRAEVLIAALLGCPELVGWAPVTRTAVVRAALARGIAALEAEVAPMPIVGNEYGGLGVGQGVGRAVRVELTPHGQLVAVVLRVVTCCFPGPPADRPDAPESEWRLPTADVRIEADEWFRMTHLPDVDPPTAEESTPGGAPAAPVRRAPDRDDVATTNPDRR